MVLLLFGKVHCSLLYLSTGSDMCRDSPDLQELRGRIIQVFFKHLTSSNEVAVDMSQEGLAAVIAYQKMPKTLLQVHSMPLSQLSADPFPYAPFIPSFFCNRLGRLPCGVTQGSHTSDHACSTFMNR